MSDDSSLGPATVVIVAVVAAAAIGLAWYWQGRPSDEPPPAPEPIAEEPVEAEPEGPEYPLPPPMERRETGELEPLPALDDSDRYFELELAEIMGGGIADLLADEALISKFVTTIDNLPRQTVAEQVRPMSGLNEKLLADGQDGSDEYTLSPSSYDRYTPLVTLLGRADRDALVELYQRYYPLFQQAYVDLGYPDAYFNDRLVEVIDHLNETPVSDEPVRLVRPHVLYEFADPELEGLSAGQKLLIRTGPENAAVIKGILLDLRERVTASPE